jgi:1-acyl-sn-glycerol-3-phosphate acyltransferase
MSDFMYRWVVRLGRPAFAVSSSPVVLHRGRAAAPGAYVLAPNHLSAYDVPCLMKESPRPLDFVSITELYRNPLVAAFFTSLNVFPLDRSRPDGPTVRIVLDRLRRGRVVAMFPEGRIPEPADSVLNGGPIKPGVARIAHLANVPVVPCVVLGTGAYSRPASWLPLRGTRYGVAFGEPLAAPAGAPEAEARETLLAEIKRSYRELHAELLHAMGAAGPAAVHRFNPFARRRVVAGNE